MGLWMSSNTMLRFYDLFFTETETSTWHYDSFLGFYFASAQSPGPQLPATFSFLHTLVQITFLQTPCKNVTFSLPRIIKITFS